jgi:hypothetical protein
MTMLWSFQHFLSSARTEIPIKRDGQACAAMTPNGDEDAGAKLSTERCLG